MMVVETVKDWLLRKYLEWQHEHGRISVRKWSEVLGMNYNTLMGLMNGQKGGTTMQTAYQIGERLNDFSILELLGYPVPDAPLTDLPEEERNAILDWLESVKRALDKVPADERMEMLNAILAELPEAETDVE